MSRYSPRTLLIRIAPIVALTAVAAFAQTPRIDSVSPSQGPIAGGMIVTLTGAQFNGASVTLDRAPIAPLSHSDSQIQVRMPARANGYAVIAVTRAGASAYAEFLYVPPRLDELAPGFITTVAGVGIFSGDYRPATQAIVAPWGLAFAPDGTIYIAEAANDRVVRVRADGVLEPFAGNGRIDGPRPAGDAPALDVPISYPRGIVLDAAGNLYVPDTTYYIWKITPSGVARIIAGNGKEEFTGDGGPARLAGIGHPTYLTVDANGAVYFLDATMMRIRKIDANGIISTVAGNGTAGFSGDGGPAVQAQFDIGFADMGGLVCDPARNLFLLDYANKRIRRIDAGTGIITTFIDPTAAGSPLNDMRGIALDASGNLYFSNAAEILRRNAAGTVERLTTGRGGFSPDGTLLSEARIGGSILSITAAGELAISESARVRRVDAAGRLQTIAGTGPTRLDEGAPAVSAVLTSPNFDVAVLPNGEVVFDDGDRIRTIDRQGFVRTIAGTGTAGPLEGVPAAEASIAANSIHVSPDGTIDFSGNALGTSTIGAEGVVHKTAGQFTPCDFAGDGGSALEAKFCQIWDVIRDSGGNLLIADTNNNRVRRIDRASGVVTTIAGSGPTNGLEHYGQGTTCGDGGPATAACINTPYGLALDDDGNLYVSQVDIPGRIRRVDPAGTITTFAQITATKLAYWKGFLYAVSKDRVLRLAADGTVTTIAGTNGVRGFSGDGGPATAATLVAAKQSHGVAVDAEGNLYFSDGDNRRIRAVRYGAVLPPPGATASLTASGTRIRVAVRDAAGRPARSVRVDFSAPASGTSCTLSHAFAITGADGFAEVHCIPNCTAGTYAVSARPVTGPSFGAVTLTNAPGPCRRRTVRH